MKKRIFLGAVIFGVLVHLGIAAAYSATLTTTTPASPEARSRGVLSTTHTITDDKAKWWLFCEGKDTIGVKSWRAWGGSTVMFSFTDGREVYYFSGNRCRIEKVKK